MLFIDKLPGLIRKVPSAIRWITAKFGTAKPVNAELITPMLEISLTPPLPHTASEAIEETSGEIKTRRQKAVEAGIGLGLHAQAAIFAFGLTNAIIGPFLKSQRISVNSQAPYILTIVTGAVYGFEYMVVRYLLWLHSRKPNDSFASTFDAGSNPALAAALPVVAGVQLGSILSTAENLLPTYLLGGVGLFFAIHRFINDVDSAQIDYSVVELGKSAKGCTPAKAGNAVGRGITIGGAAFTLTYSATELARIIAVINNSSASTVVVGLTSAGALALGIMLGVVVYRSTLRSPYTLENRTGRVASSIDGVLHNVPPAGTLAFRLGLDGYVASVSHNGAIIDIKNNIIIPVGVIALINAVLRGVVEVIRSAHRYDRWSRKNLAQVCYDEGSLISLSSSSTNEAQDGVCSKSASQFFLGAERKILIEELREVTTSTVSVESLEDTSISPRNATNFI
jgi:hypothetical protein